MGSPINPTWLGKSLTGPILTPDEKRQIAIQELEKEMRKTSSPSAKGFIKPIQPFNLQNERQVTRDVYGWRKPSDWLMNLAQGWNDLWKFDPSEDPLQTIGPDIGQAGLPFSSYAARKGFPKLFTESMEGLPHHLNPTSQYNYGQGIFRGFSGSGPGGKPLNDPFVVPISPQSKNVLDLKEPNIDDLAQALGAMPRSERNLALQYYKHGKEMGQSEEKIRKTLAKNIAAYYAHNKIPPSFDAIRIPTDIPGNPLSNQRELFNFPSIGESPVTTPEGIPITHTGRPRYSEEGRRIVEVPNHIAEASGLPQGTEIETIINPRMEPGNIDVIKSSGKVPPNPSEAFTGNVVSDLGSQLEDLDVSNRPPGTGLRELQKLEAEADIVEGLGGLTGKEIGENVPLDVRGIRDPGQANLMAEYERRAQIIDAAHEDFERLIASGMSEEEANNEILRRNPDFASWMQDNAFNDFMDNRSNQVLSRNYNPRSLTGVDPEIAAVFGKEGHPFVDEKTVDIINDRFRNVKNAHPGISDIDALEMVFKHPDNQDLFDRYMDYLDDPSKGFMREKVDAMMAETSLPLSDVVDSNTTMGELDYAFHSGDIDGETWAAYYNKKAREDGVKFVTYNPSKPEHGAYDFWETEASAKQQAEEEGWSYMGIDEYIEMMRKRYN